MTRVRSAFLSRLLAACLGTGLSTPAFAGEHLTMGIISPRSPDLIRPAYQALAEEIGRVLDGATIEVDPVGTYPEGLKRLRAGKWQMAFATDLTYLKVSPLGFRSLVRVTENSQSVYRSVILVRKDSPYRELKDLRGLHVAFTATDSVSGFVYPAKMLRDAGLRRGRDYTPEYIGNARRITAGLAHPTALITFQAGGLFEGSLKNFPADAPFLRVLATSPPIPHIPFIAGPTVLKHPGWRDRLTKALLDMKRTHPEVFNFKPAIFFDGFAPPDDRAYETVDRVRREVGL